MIVEGNSKSRDVKKISDDDMTAIRNFLQGAVYCWCKNRKNEWFSLRDLMGGDNFHWQGTPLFSLYQKHKDTSDNPTSDAGKDAGWILKKVISDDNRKFKTKKEEMIRKYRWVEE